MLDGLKLKLAGAALGSVLKSLATNKNTQTTITGLIAGAILVIPGLNLGQLIAGDPVQIAHLAAGLVVWAISILATHKGHDGTTTVLGVIGAVLQGSSGQIQDLTVAVVIALLGHLTNKPVAKVEAPPAP
jgi:hypothetical protein